MIHAFGENEIDGSVDKKLKKPCPCCKWVSGLLEINYNKEGTAKNIMLGKYNQYVKMNEYM